MDVKTSAELLLAIFGIIGGLYFAIKECVKLYASYATKRKKWFEGKWGNEGIIGGPSLTHLLELDISCDGTEISGSFDVRKEDEEHTWHGVSFNGKFFLNRASCNITHMRNGEVLDFGHVILIKKGKNLLLWKLNRGVEDFFPITTQLFRINL